MYMLLDYINGSKGLSNIHPAEQFHALLEREKARVERNSHQFSLVLFQVSKAKENRSQKSFLIQSLTNRIRVADEVGWLDEERIGVILPDTSAIGAKRFAQSTCEAIVDQCSLPEYTVYTYPSTPFPNSNGHFAQLTFADVFPQWGTGL